MTPNELFNRFQKLIKVTYDLEIPEDARQSPIEAVWEANPQLLNSAFDMLGVENEGITAYPHLKNATPAIGRIYVGMHSHDAIIVSVSCDYNRLYQAYAAWDKIKYLTDIDKSIALKVWAKYEQLERSIGSDPDLAGILNI